MKLGVCYYPEHWPESIWAQDAARMKALGITIVRIGEFAWSRLEPQRGNFNFDWLHRALDTLHAEGLQVVMSTPTATPPKWLIDEHPSILAVDEHGHSKGFGSRRHYCFSSTAYRDECHRIVSLIAKEFAGHPSIIAWQTDNEYGCHSTIESFSNDAKLAFRQWCEKRYQNIDALNQAWCNVFWSMEYNSFDQIDLPCGAVTELNPAHRLAFWRFSSDQVATFNKLQTDILRQHAPQHDLLHNYMGNFTEFDHYTTAADLDIASWDNYPLGFLDRDSANLDDQQKWFRTGHPDSSTFHHDLYRGVGRGRLWIIEQQPGPVNWAPHNPTPLPGMVKLWAHEAYAHSAEVMSWFRWRQLPGAQEQMHTGLLRPDHSEDTAVNEIKTLVNELAALEAENTAPRQCEVAMVFDYTGDQMCRIQPQGQNFEPLHWVLEIYTALRRCGVNVDVVPAGASLDDYRFVVVANSVSIEAPLLQAIESTEARILFGPRSGSKTTEYSIPDNLAPGVLQKLLPLKVIRTESLPDFAELPLNTTGLTAWRWREEIETTLTPAEKFDDGWGFHYAHDRFHYLNCCLKQESLVKFIRTQLELCGINIMPCSEGLRYSHTGDLTFAFNYGPAPVTLDNSHQFVIGGSSLNAGEVAVFKRPHNEASAT